MVRKYGNCLIVDLTYRCQYLHSFIHSYWTFIQRPSRELLRGAPDSSTAKKSSLKLRKNAGYTLVWLAEAMFVSRCVTSVPSMLPLLLSPSWLVIVWPTNNSRLMSNVTTFLWDKFKHHFLKPNKAERATNGQESEKETRRYLNSRHLGTLTRRCNVCWWHFKSWTCLVLYVRDVLLSILKALLRNRSKAGSLCRSGSGGAVEKCSGLLIGLFSLIYGLARRSNVRFTYLLGPPFDNPLEIPLIWWRERSWII